MPVKLQLSNLESIPFIGSGKKLQKNKIEVGSKVIVKEVSGIEHTANIISFNSNIYTGTIKSGSEIKFYKENVFLIL